MSEENTARIYTVNLSKAWDTPKYRRTDRVINIIKEFTERHMQTDKVKIDQDLNRHIWSRGKKNPPRKIRLRMVKEEDDTVVVSSYIEEKRTESESEEISEVVEKKVEEPKQDKGELKEVVEKKVEEPKQDKGELKEVVEKKVEEPKQDKVQANWKSKTKQE